MIYRELNPFSFPPEMELMLALALRQEVQNVPPSLDMDYFMALVTKNRMEPLVAEGLKKLPAQVQEAYGEFRSVCHQQKNLTFSSMRQMQVLASLMQGFQKANIRAISLKGPLLAADIYGNPSMRYSRDLDLLVSEGDFPAACKYMESLGYEEEINVFNKTPKRRKKLASRGEEMHTAYHKDGICVEIHWRISFRMEETFERLWERRDSRVLLGQKIPVLGEQDNLVYLICHAAGHGFLRLRWLLDLYEILKKPGCSADALYELYAQRNIGAVFLETLLLLYLCPILTMPELDGGLISIRRGDNRIEIRCADQLEKDLDLAIRLAELLRATFPMTEIAMGSAGKNYFYLLPKEKEHKSIGRHIVSFFEPCRADLELVDLPDALYFLYYIIRPFHKLWRLLPFGRKKS